MSTYHSFVTLLSTAIKTEPMPLFPHALQHFELPLPFKKIINNSCQLTSFWNCRGQEVTIETLNSSKVEDVVLTLKPGTNLDVGAKERQFIFQYRLNPILQSVHPQTTILRYVLG